ncbi:hypothetical protein D1872_312300 [compost metagenome]
MASVIVFSAGASVFVSPSEAVLFSVAVDEFSPVAAPFSAGFDPHAASQMDMTMTVISSMIIFCFFPNKVVTPFYMTPKIGM